MEPALILTEPLEPEDCFALTLGKAESRLNLVA